MTEQPEEMEFPNWYKLGHAGTRLAFSILDDKASAPDAVGMSAFPKGVDGFDDTHIIVVARGKAARELSKMLGQPIDPDEDGPQIVRATQIPDGY